jgi:AAA+ ATPase superfamily predicted ATPase
MRFYDRETEMSILEKNRIMSKERGVFTVITGRRRIGKTALIKESEKNGKTLYFFVPRTNEILLCEQLALAARTDLGMTLINSGRFRDLFEQLMRYGKENNFTFVIDEFQELKRIDKSIMSSIQELWDEHGSGSKVNLIVCGSVQSMMVRIFERSKEPLFGRATSKLNVGHFRPSVLKNILRDHNPGYGPDDLLFLYMVTGGVPKYIELMMDAGATSLEKMLDRICSPDSYFLTEGRDLLISEFGKDHGTYFSILQLIANGKNTLKEINDSTGKDVGTYLENLEKEYSIIRKNRPIFSKENSRDVRWQISDNYLRFYFRFVNSNLSTVEFRRYDLLRDRILSGYAQYSGKVLEDYFKEKIAEEERFTDIGSYWDRKGENEIDIVILNGIDRKATLAEVKRNPKKGSIGDLRRMSETVPGLRGYEIGYMVLSMDDM